MGISWPTVRYMIGEVQYGGRVTDDYDKRLLNTYAKVWFSENIFTDTFEFYRGYNIPKCRTLDEYQTNIDNLPLVDSPECFGLHSNADITFDKFSIVIHMSPNVCTSQIFEGNSDSFSVKHNYFDEPIRARYIKIHTYTWHNHPSLRVELIGCQSCKQLIGIPPYARFAASSSRGKRSQRSCTPEYGHYLSNKAWCAQRQDALQWLQVDVGPPTLITGVILKSRGDVKNSQYVTRFKLSYSNDTRLWYFYKDAAPLDPRSTVWSFEWSQKMKESDDKIQSDKVKASFLSF
ncbi:hypothetical protein MN116_008800 [Schistosoma mekongi]|uniref:F5/8 type C domain-containing protein n=1 Tax=Schistosoma mekongi TaxID=38744 RepID=A0AAE1Z5T1_SCHME|nr:hypothetical protein MN116_008800 [Schistosoma mekongi]